MSNIIPMVSSSPPPMDEGGGFEWDDDDDDFGTFTSASDNSFAQSAKADTSIPDHFNSEPHTNNSDGFADFAAFPSNEQEDPANMQFSQSSDNRPESINISCKPSCNEESNDTNNDRNNYHNGNGQLIDSGVYSSNVSPVQCEENSGVNNIDEPGISKCQPHDVLSCSLSEKLENTSVENEISDIKSDTGGTIPCDVVSDTQENASVVTNSETNCVTEFQDDSVKYIPPKDIPENDNVHVSGSLNTDNGSIGEGEMTSKSANVVIPNCDSDTDDTMSSDNTHSVSNYSYQESGHEQNVNRTDLKEVIPDLEIDAEEEVNEKISSYFGSFSTESVKPLENVTEKESESLQTINAEINELRDQQGAEECTPESSTENDSETSGANDENKKVDRGYDESGSVKDKCENNEFPEHEISDSEIVTVKVDAKDTSEHSGISCESSDEKMIFASKDEETDQVEPNIECVFENKSKSVEDLKLIKDAFEDDSDNNLQDEPVSDNDNSNSQEEPSDSNAIIIQNEDTPISEDADDDFCDFSTTNITSGEEHGDFNTTYDKNGNETESDDYGEFNASFETKSNSDSLIQKDEEFGDFNASFDSKPFSNISEMAENNEEFGDFNTTFADNSENKEPPVDDFGDFNATFDSASNVNEQTNDWAAFSEPQTVTRVDEDDDDDDWAGFEEGDSSDPSVSETVPVQNKMEDTSKFANMTKHEKLLYAVTTCFPALITDIEEYDTNLGELQDLHIESSSHVWGQVKGQETTEALSYHWTKSLWNSQLFATLHIDTKNILIGHKKAPVPVYAAGLTLLEPTKGQTSLKPGALVDASHPSLNSTSQMQATPVSRPNKNDSIPAAQFDWSSSGLTNPLEANNKTLNLDFLIQDQATKSNALESEFLSTNDSPVHKPAIQPLENILANLKTSSTFKPTNQNEDVSKEASKILLSLPDLLFMKSKVLMFPVKLDGVEN